MSIKHDLMYPFGDPLRNAFNDRTVAALCNIVALAKERIWIAEGEPIDMEYNDFGSILSPESKKNAETSVDIMEQFISDLNKHNNE